MSPIDFISEAPYIVKAVLGALIGFGFGKLCFPKGIQITQFWW